MPLVQSNCFVGIKCCTMCYVLLCITETAFIENVTNNVDSNESERRTEKCEVCSSRIRDIKPKHPTSLVTTKLTNKGMWIGLFSLLIGWSNNG